MTISYKNLTISVEASQKIKMVERMDIRKLRLVKGLKQECIAQKAGISASYISMLESGKRKPSPAVAKRLGKALGVPWTQFFEEPEKEAHHG